MVIFNSSLTHGTPSHAPHTPLTLTPLTPLSHPSHTTLTPLTHPSHTPLTPLPQTESFKPANNINIVDLDPAYLAQPVGKRSTYSDEFDKDALVSL